MKKFNLVAMSLVLSSILGFAAHADEEKSDSNDRKSIGGLFVEPSLTYERGATSIDYPAPFKNSTGDSIGLGVGARLGIHVADIVFVGADGRYSMTKFKDSSNNYDADAKGWNLGPVVGIQTPIAGLRVWGSYVLASQLDPESSNGVNVKFADGKGYRLGVGMYVSVVSLNLEYQELKYGKATLEEIGPFSPGTSFGSVNLTDKSWIASVSFPVAL